MSDIKIMLVDDEEIILESIKDFLSEYNITAYPDAREALKELKNHYYDIVIADYRMPELTGLDLLIEAKKSNAYFYGILLTAYAEKKLLEEFINLNLIKKVIEKPLNLTLIKKNIDEAIADCQKEQKHRLELQQLKSYYENAFGNYPYLSKEIIGIDSGLKDVFITVKKVAVLNENVILTGETGTGKELIARTIHSLSPRRAMPFIRINCGAIPDNLMESELFGYKKGAFTGADTDKIGKIELAHGGTLFLDEIAELKTELQTRFLHVLQDKEVERLGSNRAKKVDFRLIAATNKELQVQIKKKLFREDLYYRISTVPIHIPPLRERIEDLPLFITYFIEFFCQEMGKKRIKIDGKAIEKLKSYSWPGNIRELENVIKRAIILTSEEDILIGEQTFYYLFSQQGEKEDTLKAAIKEICESIIQKKEDLKSVEKYILSSILTYFHGNIQEAVRSTLIPKDRFYRNR
jgi:DNA-binding NtrC family response regulator